MWRLILRFLAFWISLHITPKKITQYLKSNAGEHKNNLEYVAPEAVRVAAAQIQRRAFHSLADFLKEMLEPAVKAAGEGAQMVVYPEYIGLLPLSLIPGYQYWLRQAVQSGTLENLDELKLYRQWIEWLGEAFHLFLAELYEVTFSTIASVTGIYVVAGTTVFYERGCLSNRCVVFAPDGSVAGEQGKTHAVGLDRQLGVHPDNHIEMIETPIGKLSILIGSDAYYFENCRIAKALGAQILAVPDSRAGIVCNLLRCRAGEQRFYAAYSCYAGLSPNTRAGVFGPPETGAQRAGVLAVADSVETDVVSVRINLHKLETGVALESGEPNQAFLQGDYLHSYCYCGALPVLDPELEEIEETRAEE